MQSRFRARPFVISFLCTALALVFLTAMLVVDAEGRRLSFNDTSPALEIVYNADGTVNLDASRRVVIKFRMKDSDMIDQMSAILEGSAQGD